MAFGFDDVLGAGLKIIDKFIPDPQAKIEAEKALRSDLMEWDKGQMEINKAEASSGSLFIGGWRPFIGWTCGSAFALHFVVMPVVNVIRITFDKPEILLTFDMQTLMTVLMGLLGMGGLRTFEKIKGVAKK